jgi:hypothetical protein
VVLSVLKVSSDKHEKVLCARLSARHRFNKAAPPRYANLSFDDCLGRKAMSSAILKPKHISRQVE